MNNFDDNRLLDKTSEGEKSLGVKTKLKEYGKEAYRPLINVVFKYQSELTPYLRALHRGLEKGAEALTNQTSSSEERYVGKFFQEAADGLDQASQKLESKDLKAFATYVSDLAEKKPSIMFSTSYVAGLFFGRLSRHIVRANSKSAAQPIINNEPPTFEQPIH